MSRFVSIRASTSTWGKSQHGAHGRQRFGRRGFLLDGDTVVMKARCESEGLTVDFGGCVGTLLPAEVI